jgi:hypothetical protein
VRASIEGRKICDTTADWTSSSSGLRLSCGTANRAITRDEHGAPRWYKPDKMIPYSSAELERDLPGTVVGPS